VTGNETPNRPSVAGTASESERNDTQDRHQERKTGTCEEPPPIPSARAEPFYCCRSMTSASTNDIQRAEGVTDHVLRFNVAKLGAHRRS
jgi:hypothetical protein